MGLVIDKSTECCGHRQFAVLGVAGVLGIEVVSHTSACVLWWEGGLVSRLPVCEDLRDSEDRVSAVVD
jgi:hypothetical protein